MSRALGTLSGALGLVLVQCMTPSASGTKTNWFHACDEDAACDDELSCICGVCTLPCTADGDCEEGSCATQLESAAACSTEPAEPAERICLGDVSECVQVTVEPDADLGDAVTATCNQEAALACESFDQPFPAEYSTWTEGVMTAVLQDCDAHLGAGAIHYSSDAPGQVQTRIRLASSVSSGPLYARFFAKVGADMVLPEQLQLLEFWDREESTVPDRIAVFLSADGAPRVYVGASGTTVEPTAPTPLPRDTWLCFELSLDVDDQAGRAELSVDGTSLLSASGFDSGPEYPISVAVIEAQPSTNAQGVDVSLDDLVVATAPIGCP